MPYPLRHMLSSGKASEILLDINNQFTKQECFESEHISHSPRQLKEAIYRLILIVKYAE